MARPFDALLFDMDGLLLDTERVFMRALVHVTTPAGLPRAEVEAFFLTLVGTSNDHTSRAFSAFLPAGFDPVGMEALWRAENKARMTNGVPLRPHVAAIVPRLRQAGYKMAVVTSTKRAPALRHLESAGLLVHFDLVVAGDEVSATKPDPAPYLQAAAALGVAPHRCAAFEDSDLGTRAAVAAGCVTTQIPDLRPPVPLPDLGQHIACDLSEAVTALDILATV